MPKKVKADSTSLPNHEDIALRGVEYYNKNERIKELTKENKEGRVLLEEYLKANGVTAPSGSVLSVVSHADVDVHLKHTLRVGKELLPEAIDVLKENGLECCIETVSIIREDVLESMYSSGKVSKEIISKIYQRKDNFAFSVDVKKRFTE